MSKTLQTPQFRPLFMASKKFKVDSFDSQAATKLTDF